MDGLEKAEFIQRSNAESKWKSAAPLTFSFYYVVVGRLEKIHKSISTLFILNSLKKGLSGFCWHRVLE